MAHSMARLWARLVAMNDGWARPFGEFNRRWATALFRPIYPIKDLLNGRWLGHPLHAAATDIPIGMLLGVVVLDVLGYPGAADIVLIGTILFMLGAAITGLADYSDTDGTALTRATLHASIMVVTLLILIVSALIRAGSPTDRALPIALSIIGFVLITIGAFVGGDVAYLLGNMVSRHAFRGAGTKWVGLDTGQVTDLQALPEATPTKMKAGINDLVVVRVGDTVHALHHVCAHAGGPLSEGKLVDGCIQCPWHGSRFRLTDGAAQRGPTVYDQPSYEIRRAEGGGYEVRRVPTA
jgi:nitrite reductase/ring-hydroxylating ferredoxin subunit